MFKERFLTSLISGFSIAVISVIPILQIGTCCLFAPLIGTFAVFLFNSQVEKKYNYTIKNFDGIIMGLMIGLIAGIFESFFQTLLILVSKTNPIEEALIQLQNYLPNSTPPDIIEELSREIEQNRFSFLLSLIILLNSSIIYSIFSSIGGLIGISYLRKTRNFKP